MSANARCLEALFEPMTVESLPGILPIEEDVYSHPWSAANFADSLRAGYQAQQLVAGGQVIAYFVAMKGVDEVHLLNLTVAAPYQRQGWARTMLDALALWSRGQGALWVWLEVRAGNERAQHVYEAYGFRRVGVRKRYYPSNAPEREDAIVMSLRLWS